MIIVTGWKCSIVERCARCREDRVVVVRDNTTARSTRTSTVGRQRELAAYHKRPGTTPAAQDAVRAQADESAVEHDVVVQPVQACSLCRQSAELHRLLG